MAFTISQSFDPRIGTMQKIFAVIYILVTLVALSLAFYVRSEGQDGYLQFFMAALFAIMAIKSIFIASRVKNLLTNGKYFNAKVDSVEPVRGITVIKGVVDIPEFGLIYIESRLAGETPAHELKRYLEEHKQDHLPALVVAVNTKHPRGMFTIKSKNGHLDEESAVLKTEEELTAQDSSQTSSTTSSKEIETTATGFKTPVEQNKGESKTEPSNSSAQSQAQAASDDKAITTVKSDEDDDKLTSTEHETDANQANEQDASSANEPKSNSK